MFTRPVYVFSDSDSIVKTTNSDRGGGGTDKRFKIVIAMSREAVGTENIKLTWFQRGR